MREMDHPAAGHKPADHPVGGSPHDVMTQIVARHLCGWLSGHSAPPGHFLPDAALIMREAHEHAVRLSLAEPVGACNAAAGFIARRVSVSAAG